MKKTKLKTGISLVSSIIFLCFALFSRVKALHNFDIDDLNNNTYNESKSIKTVNGKFYAYIVLLFNENPHFVNLIQKSSIPPKLMANEGFHIKEYKNYINTITNRNLKYLSKTLLTVYLEPEKFDAVKLRRVEHLLSKRDVIVKFSRDKNPGINRIILDYCIFGKKYPVNIKHPLVSIRGKIFNIKPYIYYDEFSTSNSTFYFDMIYINSEEVHNDYIIAKNIIRGKDVSWMFFVGSKVTEDIKFCLIKAFKNSNTIKKKIWEMFVIHELTHKYFNNRYNYFDQVIGEELSLASTIYSNPYLGLSVMYSYLNYNAINPHRIAAVNFVKFISVKTNDRDILENHGKLKLLNENRLKTFSREYFESIVKKLDE